MTERLNRGRPPLYPWDEWFDGQFRVLRRGTHFDPDNTGRPSAASMRALVKHTAAVRGGRADTRVPDADSVQFVFVKG